MSNVGNMEYNAVLTLAKATRNHSFPLGVGDLTLQMTQLWAPVHTDVQAHTQDFAFCDV